MVQYDTFGMRGTDGTTIMKAFVVKITRSGLLGGGDDDRSSDKVGALRLLLLHQPDECGNSPHPLYLDSSQRLYGQSVFHYQNLRAKTRSTHPNETGQRFFVLSFGATFGESFRI